MRLGAAYLVAALLLAAPAAGLADGRQEPQRMAASVKTGKPAAPVEIAASFDGDHARVEVGFLAAASTVTVGVRGLDGLVVTSEATPISGAFAKGTRAAATVKLTVPPGQSNLVVTVSGVFAGVRTTRTATFTLGRPTPAQAEQPSTGVKVEPSGERLKELPATRQEGGAR
jgi:hypothetical protein